MGEQGDGGGWVFRPRGVAISYFFHQGKILPYQRKKIMLLSTMIGWVCSPSRGKQDHRFLMIFQHQTHENLQV